MNAGVADDWNSLPQNGNVEVATGPPLRALSALRIAWGAFLAVGMTSTGGQAQEVSVSGVVVEAGQSSPIAAASIQFAGLAPVFTDASGRFRFNAVIAGRHTLTVSALGYHRRSLSLVIRADTALRIELDPEPFALDTLVVQPRNVTVRGTIRDSMTRQKILEAQVTEYPGFRTVGAISGAFVLRDVQRGRATTIVVEAPDYLSARIAFVPAEDTALSFELRPDPVALRMVAQQAERLDARAQTVAIPVADLDQDEIRRSGAQTVMDLLRRLLPPGAVPDRMPASGGSRPCVFLDDLPFAFSDFYGFNPDGIDRIEVYGHHGEMIRVYTRRYLRRLMKASNLPRVIYMNIGTGAPACR